MVADPSYTYFKTRAPPPLYQTNIARSLTKDFDILEADKKFCMMFCFVF